MVTINTYSQPPLSPPPPMKPEVRMKSTARSEPSGQPEQKDSYEKSTAKVVIAPPKGAVKHGEMWVWPPDALVRVDKSGGGDRLLSQTMTELSGKGSTVGSGGTSGFDAEFKSVLTREAVEYSDLEKRIHNLLGYTLETFKTTFKAEGELSAWQSLLDGTYFSSAFSAYAASYSISSKYTFDDSFRAQYNTSPSMAVEYNFDSLKAMMESVVIKQSGK